MAINNEKEQSGQQGASDNGDKGIGKDTEEPQEPAGDDQKQDNNKPDTSDDHDNPAPAPEPAPTPDPDPIPEPTPDPEPEPAPEPDEPEAEHGVAVGTATFDLIFHGREGEVIHIDTISYPVDAYGDATDPIYHGCGYTPEDYYFGAPGYDYVITSYTLSDGKMATERVDLRPYVINGEVHLKMEWFSL